MQAIQRLDDVLQQGLVEEMVLELPSEFPVNQLADTYNGSRSSLDVG